jgi:hypothetical protein
MSDNAPVTRLAAPGEAANDGEVRPALELVGLSKSCGAGRVLVLRQGRLVAELAGPQVTFPSIVAATMGADHAGR